MAPSTGILVVLKHPDIRIFYEVNGALDSSRPIVLLSNSLAASTRLWDDLVNELGHAVTFVRYDSRFHGQSPLSEDPGFDYHTGHSMDDLATDVLLLLDHLEITRVDLAIGLSIGAGVVLLAGAKHPERFGHVLVVGTKAKSPNGADAAYDARIAYGQEYGSRALGQQSAERWFPTEWAKKNTIKFAQVEEMVGRQSLEGYIAGAAALRKLDLWPPVSLIQEQNQGNRFTFVAGEHDADIPDDSRELAKIAGSEVIIVPASGHIVNVQQPESFYVIVKNALVKAENSK